MKQKHVGRSAVHVSSTPAGKALKIVRNNTFSIDDGANYFSLRPTKEQFQTLAYVPFSEAVLEACVETHLLSAVFPMSILYMREMGESEDWRAFHEDGWYRKDTFANYRGETGWHLIQKMPVENSLNKSLADQLALLDEENVVPTSQVLAYTVIGHYLKTNQRLFDKVCVRCSDTDSEGSNVSMGRFDRRGLRFGSNRESGREYLALASAKKPLSSQVRTTKPNLNFL